LVNSSTRVFVACAKATASIAPPKLCIETVAGQGFTKSMLLNRTVPLSRFNDFIKNFGKFFISETRISSIYIDALFCLGVKTQHSILGLLINFSAEQNREIAEFLLDDSCHTIYLLSLIKIDDLLLKLPSSPMSKIYLSMLLCNYSGCGRGD
jgi:hypothetical protein